MAELFTPPRITAQDADGKIAQLTSYVYQLVEQLNWAFNALPGAGQDNIPGSTNGR